MDILHKKRNPKKVKCMNIRWDYSDTKVYSEQSERKKIEEL